MPKVDEKPFPKLEDATLKDEGVELESVTFIARAAIAEGSVQAVARTPNVRIFMRPIMGTVFVCVGASSPLAVPATVPLTNVASFVLRSDKEAQLEAARQRAETERRAQEEIQERGRLALFAQEAARVEARKVAAGG